MWNPYLQRRKWSWPRVFSTLHATLISKEITIPAVSLLLLHTASSCGVIPFQWLQPPSSHHLTWCRHTGSSTTTTEYTFNTPQRLKKGWNGNRLSSGFVPFSKQLVHQVISLFLIKAVAPFRSLIKGWGGCTQCIWPKAKTCDSWAAALLWCGSIQNHTVYLALQANQARGGRVAVREIRYESLTYLSTWETLKEKRFSFSVVQLCSQNRGSDHFGKYVWLLSFQSYFWTLHPKNS